MVSILPSERTSFDVLTRKLGEGMQNAMPTIQRNAEIQRGLTAIEKLQNSLKSQNGQPVDQADVLANLAKVQALNQGFERSPYAEYVMKTAAANAAKKAPLPGMQGEEFKVPQRGEEVNFLNRPSTSEFSPNNLGPSGNVGNAPQQATTGLKKRVESPDESARNAPAYAREMTEVHKIPTTPKEAYDLLRDRAKDDEQYNEKIDKETEKRVLSQEKYGKKGLQAVEKLFPNPSDELKTIVKRWGEEASKMGEAGEGSEAEIERFINNKVKNLSDSVTNAKKTLSNPRVFDKMERSLDGTYRNFESSAKDVRNHLKPLLDLGLYEEARGILEELNYGPEEREMVINPLSEREQIALNSLPDAKGTDVFRKFKGKPAPSIENMKSALLKLRETSPNFSPLLARKYAEDKGYDWKIFKDAWNQLLEEDYGLEEGQPKRFELNDDQERQSGRLNTPPLNMLDKILNTMDLIGR